MTVHHKLRSHGPLLERRGAGLEAKAGDVGPSDAWRMEITPVSSMSSSSTPKCSTESCGPSRSTTRSRERCPETVS